MYSGRLRQQQESEIVQICDGDRPKEYGFVRVLNCA